MAVSRNLRHYLQKYYITSSCPLRASPSSITRQRCKECLLYSITAATAAQPYMQTYTDTYIMLTAGYFV